MGFGLHDGPTAREIGSIEVVSKKNKRESAADEVPNVVEASPFCECNGDRGRYWHRAWLLTHGAMELLVPRKASFNCHGSDSSIRRQQADIPTVFISLFGLEKWTGCGDVCHCSQSVSSPQPFRFRQSFSLVGAHTVRATAFPVASNSSKTEALMQTHRQTVKTTLKRHHQTH